MDAATLRERTAAFARDVARYTRPLLDEPAVRHAALQLTRSSASVAANCRAVTCGQMRAQFRAKICVTLEEADESVYWLQRLVEEDAGDRAAALTLLREARELTAIYGASRRTLMAELKRLGEPKPQTRRSKARRRRRVQPADSAPTAENELPK